MSGILVSVGKKVRYHEASTFKSTTFFGDRLNVRLSFKSQRKVQFLLDWLRNALQAFMGNHLPWHFSQIMLLLPSTQLLAPLGNPALCKVSQHSPACHEWCDQVLWCALYILVHTRSNSVGHIPKKRKCCI